jgi:Uma2 family endonuclease
MTTQNAQYRGVVDHLPSGGILVLHDVTWESYEQLLEDLWDRPGVRLTYDLGRLEIMTPLPEHEEYNRFVERIVDALGDELDLNVESRGSTTWKRSGAGKGTEPDSCFYVANALRIIGRRQIDLETDPPPDIVVEIDTTNESLSKFSIYASFGVPEIWRYDARRGCVAMYELRGTGYVELSSSRSFPILTAAVLTKAIEQSKSQGQKAALSAFRRWIRDASSGAGRS